MADSFGDGDCGGFGGVQTDDELFAAESSDEVVLPTTSLARTSSVMPWLPRQELVTE